MKSAARTSECHCQVKQKITRNPSDCDQSNYFSSRALFFLCSNAIVGLFGPTGKSIRPQDPETHILWVCDQTWKINNTVKTSRQQMKKKGDEGALSLSVHTKKFCGRPCLCREFRGSRLLWSGGGTKTANWDYRVRRPAISYTPNDKQQQQQLGL